MVAESLYASFPGEALAAFGQVSPGQRRVGSLIDELLGLLKDLLAKIDVSQLDEEAKQFILDTIVQVYNSVIRPLNIPYVPDLAEPTVDDWILSVLVAAAKAILKM